MAYATSSALAALVPRVHSIAHHDHTGPWRDGSQPMTRLAPPANAPMSSLAQAGMISRNSSGSLPALPVV